MTDDATRCVVYGLTAAEALWIVRRLDKRRWPSPRRGRGRGAGPSMTDEQKRRDAERTIRELRSGKSFPRTRATVIEYLARRAKEGFRDHSPVPTEVTMSNRSGRVRVRLTDGRLGREVSLPGHEVYIVCCRDGRPHAPEGDQPEDCYLSEVEAQVAVRELDDPNWPREAGLSDGPEEPEACGPHRAVMYEPRAEAPCDS